MNPMIVVALMADSLSVVNHGHGMWYESCLSPYENDNSPVSRCHVLTGLIMTGGSWLSGFTQRVSVLPVEFAEPETVCGEPHVCRRLPFVLIHAVYVFDSFGIGVGITASQVDEPLRGVRSHPDAVAGAGINNEKRVVCVAPDYGDRLNGNGLISVDVKCGEHSLFLSGFRFAWCFNDTARVIWNQVRRVAH